MENNFVSITLQVGKNLAFSDKIVIPEQWLGIFRKYISRVKNAEMKCSFMLCITIIESAMKNRAILLKISKDTEILKRDPLLTFRFEFNTPTDAIAFLKSIRILHL